MLRMYFLANWFNLADEACEEALYDVPLFRAFCRIDLGHDRAPDATTLLKFRHLLEAHNLGVALFAKVGELLQANGVKLSGGTEQAADPGGLRGTLADSSGGTGVLAAAGGEMMTYSGRSLSLPARASLTYEEARDWMAKEGGQLDLYINKNKGVSLMT
jgi:IS5 family transposase